MFRITTHIGAQSAKSKEGMPHCSDQLSHFLFMPSARHQSNPLTGSDTWDIMLSLPTTVRIAARVEPDRKASSRTPAYLGTINSYSRGELAFGHYHCRHGSHTTLYRRVNREPTIMTTDLLRAQRKILKLLRLNATATDPPTRAPTSKFWENQNEMCGT